MTLQLETTVSLLEGLDWFSSLTEEELAELASNAETVEWDAGEVIFEAGDPGDSCYVLHSGSVRVLRRFADGRRITLARLGPGSVVGELALFEGERRSATVQASESTVALALAAKDVMSVLSRDAEAALGMATTLAQRLRAANERILEHALETVAGRVAATLLAQVESRRMQGAGERDVEVVGSPTDIARLAGASKDSVARVLHWLENEGIITLKRGKMIVHDSFALSDRLH